MNLLGNLVSDTPDLGLAMLGLGIIAAFVLLFMIIGYIYSSITLMITANKLKTQNSWLAWVPIGNYYLKAKMAKKNPWPTFLYILFVPSFAIAIYSFIVTMSKVNSGEFPTESVLFIAAIGVMVVTGLIISIFDYIYTWKICEARKRPGYWAIIPLASLIVIPLSFIPVLGPLLSNIASLAASIWSMVMWGILAWGK
jgi:hypothetical protein